MAIVVDTVLATASLITAVSAIIGLFVAVHNWVLRQKKQDTDIENLKKENVIVIYALSACLDGLKQLGTDGAVDKAKKDIDKYLNEQAHK